MIRVEIDTGELGFDRLSEINKVRLSLSGDRMIADGLQNITTGDDPKYVNIQTLPMNGNGIISSIIITAVFGINEKKITYDTIEFIKSEKVNEVVNEEIIATSRLNIPIDHEKITTYTLKFTAIKEEIFVSLEEIFDREKELTEENFERLTTKNDFFDRIVPENEVLFKLNNIQRQPVLDNNLLNAHFNNNYIKFSDGFLDKDLNYYKYVSHPHEIIVNNTYSGIKYDYITNSIISYKDNGNNLLYKISTINDKKVDFRNITPTNVSIDTEDAFKDMNSFFMLTNKTLIKGIGTTEQQIVNYEEDEIKIFLNKNSISVADKSNENDVNYFNPEFNRTRGLRNLSLNRIRDINVRFNVLKHKIRIHNSVYEVDNIFGNSAVLINNQVNFRHKTILTKYFNYDIGFYNSVRFLSDNIIILTERTSDTDNGTEYYIDFRMQNQFPKIKIDVNYEYNNDFIKIIRKNPFNKNLSGTINTPVWIGSALYNQSTETDNNNNTYNKYTLI